MLAQQLVFRILVVIESERLPILLGMARLAFIAVFSFMAFFLIIFSVASHTGHFQLLPGRRTGYALLVASVTLGVAVLALKRVFCVLIVIEVGRFPALVIVAALTFVAQASAMALYGRRQPTTVFSMTARIYKPSKTAMQSGHAKTKDWVIDFEPEEPRQVEPLMGWTSSGDMRQQLRLRFASKEEAISYCERHAVAYQVSEDKPSSRRGMCYSDNFAFNRKRLRQGLTGQAFVFCHLGFELVGLSGTGSFIFSIPGRILSPPS